MFPLIGMSFGLPLWLIMSHTMYAAKAGGSSVVLKHIKAPAEDIFINAFYAIFMTFFFCSFKKSFLILGSKTLASGQSLMRPVHDFLRSLNVLCLSMPCYVLTSSILWLCIKKKRHQEWSFGSPLFTGQLRPGQLVVIFWAQISLLFLLYYMQWVPCII